MTLGVVRDLGEARAPGGPEELAEFETDVLAEFIRELIVEGTREGVAAARAAGKRLGWTPAMDDEQVRHARDLLTRPENSVSSIARLLGVSRSTLYKHVPELTGGHPGALSAGEGR